MLIQSRWLAHLDLAIPDVTLASASSLEPRRHNAISPPSWCLACSLTPCPLPWPPLASQSSTVKSDNKPQKVVIGVVTLPSTFRHYVVPAKEASAYIQVGDTV